MPPTPEIGMRSLPSFTPPAQVGARVIGMVIVADGTDDAARRLERVLWNDPGTGVMRHADAGYDIAVDCAREQGLDLPMVTA